MNKSRLASATIGLLFLAMIIACSGLDDETTTEPTANKTPSQSSESGDLASGARYAAFKATEKVIEPLLLSPTTAEWPWDSITAERIHKGEQYEAFRVQGVVDAKNANGVPIRHHWETIEVHDNENGEYFPVRISLNGQIVWGSHTPLSQLFMADKLGKDTIEALTSPAATEGDKTIHRFNRADSGRRSQIRAIIKDYPKSEVEWKKVALNLCRQYASEADHFLVMIFSDESCLENWDGSGALRDSDWPHWLCQVVVDESFGELQVSSARIIDQAGDKTAPASETVNVPSFTDPQPTPTTDPWKPIKTRIWRDITGEHEIEAEFAGYVAGKVKLKCPDGRIIEIDLEQLSTADQEYIRNKR